MVVWPAARLKAAMGSCLGGQNRRPSEVGLEVILGRISTSGRCHGESRKLEEDYAVSKQVISSSGNGEVRLASSFSQPGQQFVVKSIPHRTLNSARKGDDSDQLMEVENHLCMDHPHVTRLHDVYETKGQFHLVMEYMEGGDLCQAVMHQGRYSEANACKAIYQILLALSYVHKQGIVHRDVKLENCLYGCNGNLKLSDFGFSRKCGTSDKEELTDGVGSLNYIAPEVVKCIHDRNCSYSTQCDMWSVGVIAFILLAGEMPFAGDEAVRMARIRRGSYNMKPGLWNSISADGEDFVRALLQVSPSKRLTAHAALQHPWVAHLRPASEHAASVGPSTVQAFQQFSGGSSFRRHCLRNLSWSLCGSDLAKIHDGFISLDADQEGTITFKTMKNVLIDKLHLVNDFELHKIFNALSEYNHDDQIHYADFLAAMVGSQITMTDEVLASAFRRFDIDGSGYITARSLQIVLGNQGNDMGKRSWVGRRDADDFIAEATHGEADRIDAITFNSYLRSFESIDDKTTIGSYSDLTEASFFRSETPDQTSDWS